MKVSDVVEDLEWRVELRNDYHFDTGNRIMRTEDILFHLRSVDQGLRVIDYRIQDAGNLMGIPWLFIHVEGRKDESK